MRKENDQIIDEEFVQVKETREINYSICFILLGLILLGSLFKIMHWPFSNVIMGFGIAGMSGYLFSTLLSIQKDNKKFFVFAIAAILTVFFFMYFRVHQFSIIFYLVSSLSLFTIGLILWKRKRK